MLDPKTIHLDLASPPKKATKEPKHERQHLTNKKHPSEGFGIAPQKRQKKTNMKGSTWRARNTQARDLASPPKKARQHLARQGKSWQILDILELQNGVP